MMLVAEPSSGNSKLSLKNGRSRRMIVIVFGCLGLFLGLGCHAEPGASDPDHSDDLIPQSFQESGETWTLLKEMSDQDRSTLEAYFRKNPSLVEGNLVKGTPAIFSNEKRHRRFYWMNRTDEKTLWLMLELKNRNIRQQEGTDFPFH